MCDRWIDFSFLFLIIERLIVRLSHCLRENVEEKLRAKVCHHLEDEGRLKMRTRQWKLGISLSEASVLPEFTECQGADAIGPGDVGCRVALAHS